MASLKDQKVNGNGETVLSMQEKSQKSSIPNKRPDLNEINKRNEAEARKDKQSVQAAAGILILVITAVILLVYFFS